MKIIQEELGSPIESFFSYISEEPVAAASFGQVSLYLEKKFLLVMLVQIQIWGLLKHLAF